MSPGPINLARKLTASLWLFMLFAWTLLFANVPYTMHFTAPVIIVASVAVVCCSFVVLYRSALYVCGAHALLVSFCWIGYASSKMIGSPSLTVVMFGYLYLLFMFPASWFTYNHPPQAYENWQCRGCGYPLFRVTTPRCPECGEEFDREAFAAKYELNKDADSATAVD